MKIIRSVAFFSFLAAGLFFASQAFAAPCQNCGGGGGGGNQITDGPMPIMDAFALCMMSCMVESHMSAMGCYAACVPDTLDLLLP